jgi:hypothetical protein
VSDDFTSSTVPITIRNQRYRSWGAFAVCGFQLLFWTSLVAVVWDPGYLFLVGAICGYVGSVYFAILAVWKGTTYSIRLGTHLETRPQSGLHEPDDVALIHFDPDPLEDYAESPTPMRLCQVTITLGDGALIRMIVRSRDVERLNEWGDHNSVVVSDSRVSPVADSKKE